MGTNDKRFFAPQPITGLLTRLMCVPAISGTSGASGSGHVCSPYYNDNKLVLTYTEGSHGHCFITTSVSCAYYLVALIGVYLCSLDNRILRVSSLSSSAY